MRRGVLDALDVVRAVQERAQACHDDLRGVIDGGASRHPRDDIRLRGGLTSALGKGIAVDDHDAALDGGVRVGIGDLPLGVNSRCAGTHS